MTSKNDITGDSLRSKELSEEGKKNWDLIFPPKERVQYIPPPLPKQKEES
jgi:hypothetical protein